MVIFRFIGSVRWVLSALGLLILSAAITPALAGEITKAEAERILKGDGKDAQALFSTSFYFEQAGQPFSALRSIERAIEVEATIPGYHARYGQLLMDRRRFKEAAAAFARAAELDPQTKAFRASQARACANAGQLPEAIQAWWKLLEGCSEKKEIQDAIRQIDALCRQVPDPAGLERVWLTGLPKFTDWNERLEANDRITEALRMQGEFVKAGARWQDWYKQETNWERRATLADRWSSCAAATPAEARTPILEASGTAWRTLFQTAPSPAQKQRAALRVATALLDSGGVTEATEILKSVVYSGDWDANLRTARLLSGCYILAGDQEARQALWKDFIERSTTRLKWEAGKRYAIKVECLNQRPAEAPPRILQLLWSSASQPRQVIPTTRLFSTAEAAQGDGLKGEYFDIDFRTLRTTQVDPRLDFSWNAGTAPAKGVSTVASCVRWTGWIEAPATEELVLFGKSNGPVRIWRDGKLVIDGWNQQVLLELNNLSLDRRFTLVRELAQIQETPTERSALWAAEAKQFPFSTEARREWANALAGSGAFAEALDQYDLWSKAVKEQTYQGGDWATGYEDHILSISAQSGDIARGVGYLTSFYSRQNDHWRIHSWLNQIQNSHGFYAALDAIERLGAFGGISRMGAARFLQNQGRVDAARPLLEAAAADGTLEHNYRREAFQFLLQDARSNEERIGIARRMLTLGGNVWERRNDYAPLISWLSRDGQVQEALKMVREADQLQEHNWRGGPEALQNLAGSILQGQRVGPGLRTPAGQEKAEAALLQFAGEAKGRADYLDGLAHLTSNLAELHARRGDYDGAVDLLRAVAKLNEYPVYHLHLAELLERKKEIETAWKEHLLYLDLEANRFAEELKHYRDKHTWLRQPPDARLSNFIESQKKWPALAEQVKARLESLSGIGREAFVTLVLSMYKQRGRPEEMVELIQKAQKLGHNPPVYATELQWAQSAIQMKNATSQADTRMRDHLLQVVEQWKQAFTRNPEDYAAALNVFKNYSLMGKRNEAAPFLEKALAVAPGDPIVLDLWGSQRMLDKDYAGAASAFEKAGISSGRPEDFEKSVVSAFELAGKSQEALELALNSLALGRNYGRGVRSVEELLDLAERSDKLAFLHEKTAARVKALRAEKKPVCEGLAQLALRLAWDHQDQALADAAIDELILLSRNPLTPWQEEWRLSQLAGRAVERRRLNDAVRIRSAMLDASLARGAAPDPSAHRELALLQLELGQSAQAANSLFNGMELAAQFSVRGTAAPAPVEPRPLSRRRRPASNAGVPQVQGSTSWPAIILGLAAQEATAGGKQFREACGERLNALIDQEMASLERAPDAYSGPLLDSSIETAFELRQKINAAYSKRAEAEGASAEMKLAYVRRLVTLATRQPIESRDPSVTLEQIRKCSAEAVSMTEARLNRKVRETVANHFASLLNVPAKERLAGVTPALVLEAYEACAQEKRPEPEMLARALTLAESHYDYERAIRYGQELLKLFPGDRQNRRNLARVLLHAGRTKEAVEILRGGMNSFSNYMDYREAGELCLSLPSPKPEEAAQGQNKPLLQVRPTTDAAAAAAEFLARAIALYLNEVGPQLDAQGKPMPDAELGGMQGTLSKASAWCGKLDEALSQLLASVFHSGAAATDSRNLETVATMYAQAGRTPELVKQVEEKIVADPRSSVLRLSLATVLESAGEWSKAAAALSAAKALDPQLNTVKRLIAALRKARDSAGALEECQEWTASFPRDAEAYRTMAEIHKEMKDETGEIRALSMLVEVAPRDADNCRSVGVMFANRKDYRRAKALLERAIELRGEEPYRHVDLAEVLIMAGEYAKAETVLMEALARDWEKGLSPELLARMPQWKGTWETRAGSLLADTYEAQKQPEAAATARLKIPAGYKRPPLENAVPTPAPRGWAWGGLGGRQRVFREE